MTYLLRSVLSLLGDEKVVNDFGQALYSPLDMFAGTEVTLSYPVDRDNDQLFMVKKMVSG